MSLLDDEEVLLEGADPALRDYVIQKETERFLALGLFRRGQVSAVVYEDKEELLLKKLSEAWKLNLDYKTSLAQRLHGIVVNAAISIRYFCQMFNDQYWIFACFRHCRKPSIGISLA